MTRKNKPPTFGEAWLMMKQESNSMNVKFDDIVMPVSHAPQMNKNDATIYYSEKCKKVFKNLGITKKNIQNDFETKLPILIEEVRKQTNIMIAREARKINNEYFREVA